MKDRDMLLKELAREQKKKNLSKDELSKLKLKLCKKYCITKIPTDIELFLSSKQEKDKTLVTKPTRSISGVAVVAIMTKPHRCPHVKKGVGPCIYCPGGINSEFGSVPQSYTGKEPATMRAIRNKFDAYLQVMNRLEQYIATGHVPDKVELIVMGGTFPSTPKKYQERFITDAFHAMNDFSKLFYKKNKELIEFNKYKKFFLLPGDIKNKGRTQQIIKKLTKLKNKRKTALEKEHKLNETSRIRCIGLTIETRPDYANLKHGNQMLSLGCTKVELGIQTIYDNILKEIRRGHSVKNTISATRILKDLGFKINYHVMLGLPGMTREKEIAALKELFANPDFRPDMLKLYPCMVLKGTKLYKQYKKGKFIPINAAQAAELIAEFKEHVPEYVRIMRVQRDIPTFVTEAGVERTNLRQYVEDLMKKKGIKCRCIRCREIGRSNKASKKIIIKTFEYNASQGKEFFISAEDIKNDAIIGFCRLRFPSQIIRKEITGKTALLRELHVYGTTVAIGKKTGKNNSQHKGFGKQLLQTAEKITKTHNKNTIVVISGVGAREYYRKQGYERDGPYMVKQI